QRENLGGDGAEHRAGAAVLVEGVDAEAREAGNLEREVALEEFLVVLALLVVHDVVHMSCTSLCSSGGMLMRRTSPSTRIMGGTPADRCRSEALFLTPKASSCEISAGMSLPWKS